MKKLSLILYTFLLSTSLLLAQQAADCEENVDATSETEVVANTLQASNTLTVNRKLAAGDTLRLIGGQVIELLPGFEADYGSVVEGENGECVELNIECFEPCQTIGLLITQNEECFYEWQNNDVPQEDRNEYQIDVCSEETTTYTLKIVKTDGSIEERNYEVEIFDLSFKEDPYYLCEGENEVKLELNNPTRGYTYEWSDREDGNVLGTGPSHTVTTTGTYHVTVSDPCGNTYSESVSVQTGITPNINVLTPDPSICTPIGGINTNSSLQKSADCSVGSVTLEVAGGEAYNWSNGSSTPTTAVNASGEYSVTVTNEQGCSATEMITVQDCDPVFISPRPAVISCATGSVLLTASEGFDSYRWENEDQVGVAISEERTLTVTNPGNYLVIATGTEGGTECKSWAGIDVIQEQLAPPTIISDPNPPVMLCNTVLLTAQGDFDTWQWQKDGTDIDGAINNTFTASETGNYTVIGTKGTNCMATSTSVAVTGEEPEMPTITTNPDPPVICNNVPVVLTAQGDFDTWQWQKDGVDVAGATNIAYDAEEVGEYTVKGFKGNCIATSEPTVVTEIEAEVDLVAYKPPVIDPSETMVDDDQGMTFVNLDNDDTNGDFDNNSNNVAGGDDELFKIKIKLRTDNERKTVKLNATGDASAIKVYKSNDKTSSYALGSDIVLTDMEGEYYVEDMWVEGINPHTAQRATQLELVYIVEGCEMKDIVDVTIVGVDNLAWQGIGGNIPTAHPDRVYTGAAAPMGASRQAVDLIVNLTVAPIYPLNIYVKAFDVDDPSAETDFIDPNDNSANHTGAMQYQGNAGLVYTPDDDNRAADKDATMTGEDGNGVAAINFPTGSIQESIQFTDLSMHPGDNYKVAANGDRDFLPQLRNLDHTDFADIFERNVGGSGAVVQFPNNYTSPILTVWRVLHLEHDSMRDYLPCENEVCGYFTDFRGSGLSSNLASRINEVQNITDAMGMPISLDETATFLDPATLTNTTLTVSNRFENGSAIIGETGGGVMINNIIRNTVDKVIFPQSNVTGLNYTLTNQAGLSIINGVVVEIDRKSSNKFIWSINLGGSTLDNTFIGGTLEIDSGLPVNVTEIDIASNTITTTSIHIPCKIRDDDYSAPMRNLPHRFNLNTSSNSFAAVYIEVVNAAVGDQQNITFRSNEEPYTPASMGRNFEPHRQSSTNEADNFWIAYISATWQGPYHRDYDPNSELDRSPPLGVTPGAATHNTDLVAGGNITLMFLETVTDAGLVADEGAVLTHEIGHQFGLSHGNDDGQPVNPQFNSTNLVSMGVMAEAVHGGTNFISSHQNLIRSRTHSPGR